MEEEKGSSFKSEESASEEEEESDQLQQKGRQLAVKGKDDSHDSEKDVITLSDEEDDQQDGDFNDDVPVDMIQALYEKVNRTRNKYRCVLTDVMIHINGKDYVLKKMTADITY